MPFRPNFLRHSEKPQGLPKISRSVLSFLSDPAVSENVRHPLFVFLLHERPDGTASPWV